MRAFSLPLLFGLSATLFLSACHNDIPRPKDALEDPKALMEAVKARSLEIESLRMKEVRLDYFGEQGRVSVRQTLLQQHPDKLRVQTYIPGFDGVAGVLVCACGQFAFHDRQEDVYYYGPSTAANVGRVLPLGLNCKDMGHVLLGGAPHDKLAEAGGTPSMRWDKETGRYAVTIPAEEGPDAGSSISLQIRHKDWTVAEMKTISSTGQEDYVYTAKDFEPQEGYMLPRKRRFVVSSGDDFSLTAGKTQINPALPEVVFSLAPPSGSSVRYLGPAATAPPVPVEGQLCP